MRENNNHFWSHYLRNKKHVPCFYRVIQTRVEVWENEKCCGQVRNQGGERGAFAPPPPTGPKGPDFDTRYPSLGVQSVK